MKLCTVCGVVTSRAGSRCTEHARQSNRSRHNALYSTRALHRLSARVLRTWRGEHGNWCPGYQRDLEGVAVTWAKATTEERTRLVQATSQRVTVEGPNVLEVRLTPMAEQVGLRALMPEDLSIESAVARPTGVGRAISTYTIPIEGRDEWVAAARRLA